MTTGKLPFSFCLALIGTETTAFAFIFAVMQKSTLVVVGGGAAGFFCAVNAARKLPNLRVILIEKSSKLLSKVRISGGGRCNLTHACFEAGVLTKKYPRGERFLKKAFRHFSPADTISWFSDRGVELKEEADGRMFPITDDSATIVDCLLREANLFGVEILLNNEVKSIEKTGSRWNIKTSRQEIVAEYCCIACGGYPKDSMFSWLTSTGHTIETPVPSLFTFNLPGNEINSLMGVVVQDTQLKISGTKLIERGPVLITHWGISGPAVLRLSAWGARHLAGLNWHFKVIANWVPSYNENSLLAFIQKYRFEKASQKLGNRNPFNLPQRFWEYILVASGTDAETRWSDLPGKEQNRLVKNLSAMELAVSGKTTFKEEFVTAGGIKLEEVDPDTMMSRIHPNLFFAGEILDVDGITGGFNFQHAWTSGWIASESIAASENPEVKKGDFIEF